MKLKLATLVVLVFALAACKPTCEQLAQALALAKSSGDATLIAAAEKAYADAKCTVPTPPPTPLPTCPESCPEGQECKDPAVGCVVKPTPPPPVVAAPLIPDEELSIASEQDGKALTWPATNDAIKRHQAVHPEAWMWRGDARCLVAGPSGIDAVFQAFADDLLAHGIVAGQSITKDGKRSDCIFVNRTETPIYEETHPFDYARACVATGPNAVKGLYRRGSPPPPVTDACPAEPCPPRVFADTGKPHWEYHAKQHTMGNGDSTPAVIKACDFCAAIGLGWYGTTPRCSCPVRPDGHAERVAVENWLLRGGPTRDSRNGQDCTPNNTDNPAAFLWGTGNCRMCDATKMVCSDWH